MRNRFALETKAAGDTEDDLDEALEAVAKTVEDRTEKKVSKLIADALKPLNEGLTNIEKKMNRPGALTLPGGAQENTEAAAVETKAVRSFLQSGARNFTPAQHLTADEMKTMTVGSDPDGGYTVFPVLSTNITKKMFDQSPMRRLSDVQTITEGDSWEEPIDHDDVGATWVSETEGRPETSTPQVGVLSVPVHEIYAMPKVSQRMIDDSSWKIGTWLEGKVSDKFGRTEGDAALLGNGIKKPKGMLTYPTAEESDLTRPWGTIQYVRSGNATAITPDSLKSLVWALRAPYRLGASWLMNSNTAGTIDKFKNVNGDYIWRDGLTAGAQPSLLGYPVEIDENMPDVGANSLPIAFGNIKKAYVIVDKAGYKLLQDPYTQKPFVLFYMYRRTGGALRNSEAVKFLRISA
ncbi:phage major capsid protein [Rhizobium johnstonii]|uniref:phage major capsid protein n=1 Tax=Rhizobium leguminosarum TaxID=384 RepID=UPI00103054AB|nr:phage major capsid protein [Rhizobium leguminosarum]TBG20628.1 phage major capsid protein [Rhizobium leguminosarum]TBG46544.1 phage major capsid protein [Rhizobium leguminosarum]TBG79515.1 phage major capsid protein [Rhizobium leguminosarum]WSG97229.1 phage major capsid protein [Rhizobium johnstonii]